MRQLSPTEMAFLAGFMMAQGTCYTSRKFADEFGIHQSSAIRALERFARVAPIYKNGTIWRVLDGTEGKSILQES